MKYTKEELDLIQNFIKDIDSLSQVNNKLQSLTDELIEEDLKQKYLNKIVRVTEENASRIFIGVVSNLRIDRNTLGIYSNFYIEIYRDNFIFSHREYDMSFSFNYTTITIEEITQEEFDECLINNVSQKISK